MKRKIFMACAALVVSATAEVGVKAYNYYSMSPLMRANLEALANAENSPIIHPCFKNYTLAGVNDDWYYKGYICSRCRFDRLISGSDSNYCYK